MISATRALSAAVEAIGFSQNVGRPRSTAASVNSAWAGVAAATTTPSIPEDSSFSTESTGVAPYFAATSLTTSGRSSVITRPESSGRLISVSVWNAPIRPSPITPRVVMGFSVRSGRAVRCRGRASVRLIGQCGEHRVDLARRRQAADRLIAVEVGGEGVALGGGDHRVLQVPVRTPGGLHGPQGGVDRAHHRGAVQRLHRPTERRGDLHQVRDPPDVGRDSSIPHRDTAPG